jgi:hypothetical protein
MAVALVGVLVAVLPILVLLVVLLLQIQAVVAVVVALNNNFLPQFLLTIRAVEAVQVNTLNTLLTHHLQLTPIQLALVVLVVALEQAARLVALVVVV